MCCQMEKQLVVTALYMPCIKTSCTTGYQFQRARSCIAELGKAESKSTASGPEKLRPISLDTSSRSATINARRNSSNRRQTTPFIDLLIARQSGFRAEV